MQTEEEEGVDHSRYLASHQEQEIPEEVSHGHQIREAKRAVLRSRAGSEGDDKVRQVGLHGRPG